MARVAWALGTSADRGPGPSGLWGRQLKPTFFSLADPWARGLQGSTCCLYPSCYIQVRPCPHPSPAGSVTFCRLPSSLSPSVLLSMVADAQKHLARARCLREVFFPGLPRLFKTTFCVLGVHALRQTEELGPGNCRGRGAGARVR